MDSLMCTAHLAVHHHPDIYLRSGFPYSEQDLPAKLGVAAGLGGACMSPLGVWLAALSPDWAVMGAAALIIAYSSVTMFRKALKAPKATKPVASSSQPDASALSSCHPERSAAGAKSKDLAAVDDRAGRHRAGALGGPRYWLA